MKKIIKKYWPVVGIILIFIVICFYLLKSGNVTVEDIDIGKLVSEEGLKLENIHFTQENPDEGVKWVLDAREVKFSDDKQYISFNDFEFNISPDDGRYLKLNGERGNYNKSTNEIELIGAVKGYTEEGYSIVTEHVIYMQDEGALRSKERVELSGPFFSVTGKGLHFKLEDMNLKVLNNVTTYIDGDLLVL